MQEHEKSCRATWRVDGCFRQTLVFDSGRDGDVTFWIAADNASSNAPRENSTLSIPVEELVQ